MILNKIKGIFFSTIGFTSFIVSSPLIVEAQPTNPNTFRDLVGNAIVILNGFIAFTVGVSVLWFLWGIVRYLTQYGNEQARAESVKTISYGIMSLFIMITIWGIIALLRSSLLGDNNVVIPQF